MLLCVTDSNIWIDLHRGCLIDEVFLLPFELMAPDVIIDELQTPNGGELVQLGLRAKELSGEQVLTVVDLADHYLRPSRQDLFALVLAMGTGAMLLTGDGSLRDAAHKMSVEVHGTIWVLDQMVNHKIIGKRERAHALRLMVNSGCRLPEDEVKARLGPDPATS